MRWIVQLCSAALVQAGTATVCLATDLGVLSANGMKEVLLEVVPAYERASGHAVRMSFGTTGALVKHVQSGTQADIVIVPREAIEQLATSGQVVRELAVDLARSAIGVAVQKGVPKPDISTVEAFRRALLAARSITYPDPGAGWNSGPLTVRMLDQLGIAEEVRAKTRFHANAAEAGRLVASGESELAIDLVPELLAQAGLEVIGPVPPEIRNDVVFTAGVLSLSTNKRAARELLRHLRSPRAIAAIRAKGMQTE